MLWSWVLSVEVQCFIVTSIILLILKNHPRPTPIIYRFEEKQQHHINIFLLFSIFSLIFNENLVFFNGLYDQPWARLSPYIFGICIGYLLRKIDTKLQISLTLMICGKQILKKKI